MFTTQIRTKKSQVVEYNIIQMLTQNLVEVESVCGPGEKKIFFLLLKKTAFCLKNREKTRADISAPNFKNS
jgi:hypothetical protein